MSQTAEELNLSRVNVRTVLLSGVPKHVSELSLSQLLDFTDETYKNVFLFAIRDCSIGVLRSVSDKLKTMGAIPFKNFISQRDSIDRNALMVASRVNDIIKLEFLINELKMDVNVQNAGGATAITYSIDYNAVQTFQWLLLHGALFSNHEIGAINQAPQFKAYFNSPACFLLIASSRNLAALYTIMRHIKTQSDEDQLAFLNAKDGHGRNALMLAAHSGAREMVSLLVATLSFDLTPIDSQGKNVIHYLFEQGFESIWKFLLKTASKIDDASAKILKEHVYTLVARTKKNKHEITDLITFSPNKYTATGRLPKISAAEIPRTARSFSGERERQLLKQMSTQLYFMLHPASQETLKEVEMMHMTFNSRNFLFIAVNEISFGSKVPELLSQEPLQTILTTPYKPQSLEGRRRSKNYATKINSRVYSENPNIYFADPTDRMHTEQVQLLLRTGGLYRLDVELEKSNVLSQNTKSVLKHIFRERDNEIYIVVVNKYPDATKLRHAEEFLSDIVEYAATVQQEDRITTPLYTCVAGKKRPCMSCAGRMQNVITQFGQRPGRFFMHTCEEQSDTAAARTVTLLLSSPSYVTRRSNGNDNGYDSASDSEPEIIQLSPR